MTFTRKPRLAHFLAISVSLLTAGCALGPNFKKPAASTLLGYTPGPLSTTIDTTNVAVGALEETSVWAQIDATRAHITINTNMLEVLRTQYAKGFASRLEVGAQESQLAQVAAMLRQADLQPRIERNVRAVELATSAGAAGEPSFADRGTSSGRTPSRREPTFS